MSNKVVYILSKVDKAVAFEWIVEELNNSEIELVFILLNDNFNTHLVKYLEKNGVEFYRYRLGTKLKYPILIAKLVFRLMKVRPYAVHTHLLEASFLGLIASKLAGVKNRYYTRHHSTFQHEFFPHAVKYDNWNNQLATKIIAISTNVQDVLIKLEKVNTTKVLLIEHGFKLERFKNPNELSIAALKEKYKISKNQIIIGTISRYIEWKGVDYVIEAFEKVHQLNPKTHLLLANAGGSYQLEIKKKLARLPEESYTEITFEPDLYSLYRLLDIYCHTPINSNIEAFGQTYVEALASGIPSVFTLSGIAKDFIEDENNALVVDFKNSEQIEIAINRILKDKVLTDILVKGGLKSVPRFEVTNMTEKLKRLYLS